MTSMDYLGIGEDRRKFQTESISILKNLKVGITWTPKQGFELTVLGMVRAASLVSNACKEHKTNGNGHDQNAWEER